MKAKDVPLGAMFRRLVDLEEGELVRMLPVMKRVAHDKEAFPEVGRVQPGWGLACVTYLCGNYVGRIREDADVEVWDEEKQLWSA